jgi:hypothetical protein
MIQDARSNKIKTEKKSCRAFQRTVRVKMQTEDEKGTNLEFKVIGLQSRIPILNRWGCNTRKLFCGHQISDTFRRNPEPGVRISTRSLAENHIPFLPRLSEQSLYRQLASYTTVSQGSYPISITNDTVGAFVLKWSETEKTAYWHSCLTNSHTQTRIQKIW